MPSKINRRTSSPATEKKSRTEDREHADRLATYRAKRRFDVTPEPAAKSSQNGTSEGNKSHVAAPAEIGPSLSSGPAFVIQKHDARRLHYDLRLEIDGAMASWAVPKGPSFDPKIRRLAVQTEDHPMAYNAFEGRIPDGEYGAGDVLIWDRGTYQTLPPGQQREMLAKGHLHVALFGDKVVGEWHLIRTAQRAGDDETSAAGKAQWLLFKAKDAYANPSYDVVSDRPESIVSGRMATRGPRRVGASGTATSVAALVEAVGEPALATAVARIPDDGTFLIEVKYDGYRLLAAKAGSDVRLVSRTAKDWSDRFRPIVDAIRGLGARECVVDGEACVVDERGRPSFAALQTWLASKTSAAPLVFAAFDLLWLDGRDLRGQPLELRRELLERLLGGQGSPLTLSRSVEGSLPDLLRAAKQAGLEGLVAKKKGSLYVAGRSGTWLKLRFDRRQDVVIIGYIPMAGAEDHVGALLLATADGARFVYAGRVGTGFDDRTRLQLARQLDARRVDQPAAGDAPRVKAARWTAPDYVCECAFTEWTRDGVMRHPRFLRMREDKTPASSTRETDSVEGRGEPPPEVMRGGTVGEAAPEEGVEGRVGEAAPEEGVDATAAHAARPKRGRGTVSDATLDGEGRAARAIPADREGGPGPTLVNPSKVLFPRDGLTKRDVWDYYTAIAPVMVPHLCGRPLTLQRYPNGIEGQEWYQQNAPDRTPGYVRLLDVGPRHDAKKRIVCDNLETLQWLSNLAALTIHQWCCRVPAGVTERSAIDGALATPDYVVLDLDPGAGPWSHLVEVARAVRRLLDALELDSYVKTSGKRGVHVVVPIPPGEGAPTHEEATGFAEQVARAVAKVLPAVATVERMKAKRHGKLYVDFGQNGEGRTVVSPYTLRARDGAVVSTPIDWSELDERLDPTQFTMKAVLDRVARRGDLFAGVLRGVKPLPRVENKM